MRYVCSAALVAFAILLPSAMFGDAGLTLANVTVGRNLETNATITLSEPAPPGGLNVTLTSNDPTLLLLSPSPEAAGSASITVVVRPGLRESPDFYVQGLASSGVATYAANAPGFSAGTGKVTLAQSGILLSVASPGALKSGIDSFSTSTDAEMSNVKIYPALLDSAGNFVARQLLAGGLTVVLDVTSSDAAVGAVTMSPVTLAGGYSSAATQFRPVGLGKTTLSVSVPHGFTAPAQFATVAASVKLPGLGMTHDLNLGKHLEVCDGVFFAKPVMQDVQLTISSDNPHVLLNAPHGEPQSGPITVTVTAGKKSGAFCVQSLSDSGTATLTASATGYTSRTAAVTLTPSGFLLSYGGPPDEAELIRKEAAEKEHGIVIHLKKGPISFGIFTAQLDPKTHRGADITIQPLRPGTKATMELKSTNPEVGTITSKVLVEGIGGDATFTPLTVGKTVVSLATPEGFTVPGNANAYTIIVTE